MIGAVVVHDCPTGAKSECRFYLGDPPIFHIFSFKIPRRTLKQRISTTKQGTAWTASHIDTAGFHGGKKTYPWNMVRETWSVNTGPVHATRPVKMTHVHGHCEPPPVVTARRRGDQKDTRFHGP